LKIEKIMSYQASTELSAQLRHQPRQRNKEIMIKQALVELAAIYQDLEK
jgi:hypothetical protein